MTPAGQGTAARAHAVRTTPPLWELVAWPTAVILGLLALARPVAHLVARANDVHLGVGSVAVVLAVSVVWIVVGAARRINAVPTLMAAGLLQAVASAVLAFVSTWIADGVPGGPLVRPTALLFLLAAGALWGLVCGALALAFQRARDGFPIS